MSDTGSEKDVESGLAISATTAHLSLNKKLSRAFLSSGMPVSFKDITYTVINSQNKKESISLLQNVGGYLLPGEMAALMGPSGSGKTTLLDLLAGRKTVGKLDGSIAFAGNKPTPQFLRRFTGYVEQFDTLLQSLTVHEMLMYTAELKRPVSETKEEKQAAVEELIDVLGLSACRDVKIGNPRVLFLDEPTSGLDSYTANEVMSVVKSLTSHGITVCATIHSPTPYCFNLFDRLLLLLRGSVVYFGPNGKAAVQYFQTLAASECSHLAALKDGENAAEWIVDFTTQADRQGRAGDLGAAYAKGLLKQEADSEVERQLALASDLDPATKEDLAVRRATTVPTWKALQTLFMYRTLKNYRNPDFLGPRVADKLTFSLIIMTLFWGIGDNLASTNLPNISAMLFMWVVLPAFGAASYVPSIVLERPLFVREQSDGLYRVSTYLTFKMIEELTLAFINSIVFANIVFWALQLQGSFVLFWIVYLVTLSSGIVIAYTIAALSPNMDVANAALPTYVTALLFFAGCLIRWVDIPSYWKWFGYIDVLRYAFGALVHNQFNGDRNVIFVNNTTVLDYYSLTGINMWGWVGIEACFTVVFCMLAYLALRFVRHVKR